MRKTEQQNPYPLRLEGSLKDWATKRAEKNKRSLNAELNLLIERAKEQEEKA